MILAPLERVVISVGGGVLGVRYAGVGVKLGRGSVRGVSTRVGRLAGSHAKKSLGRWLDLECGARPVVLCAPAGIPASVE
ncbi:hypothetical protein DUNSADRAFT_13819 [Dunaliella salina]|uniref:Encoded protein n=1 Tax=Dunaliella salina TaxID=3046 RepID=A0ABQ7G8L7_DUNSA|nr:hypothetical protein DUNSADRAFT_13819 [Dunaliella salina]|eukprot:KAF5830936.1 hypothetical protein DUNSADRAFT_13819 [Dunaliella salina]